MYAGDQPWNPKVLDVGEDDYFRHGRDDCPDLSTSGWLDTYTPPPPDRPAGPVRPVRVTVAATPRRDRRPPFRFTVSGRVVLPAGADRSRLCRGTISMRVSRGARTVLTRGVPVRGDCTFRTALTVPPRRVNVGVLRVSVRLVGNGRLAGRSARPLFVRAG